MKWTSEVFGYRESKRSGRADGDVRVASEIEEELQSVAERETPDIRAAPVRDMIEARIDTVARKNSLPQQLRQLHHKHAGGDAAESASDVTRRCGLPGAKLRKHFGQAADRSRDHDREERHIQRKFDKRWVEFLAAVKVKQIAHCLEGPEGDA